MTIADRKKIKMKKMFTALLGAALFCASCSKDGDNASKNNDNQTRTEESQAMSQNNLQSIAFETIDGDKTSMGDFAGKAILIVNVASECGFTPQYAGLEELYGKHKDKGFVVIGFPANNFGSQEPGTNAEILKFCTTEYKVTFPMMAKVSVAGDDKHPLFVELTENSGVTGEIQWNFSKFLIDRDGKLVARFGSKTKPLSEELNAEILSVL